MDISKFMLIIGIIAQFIVGIVNYKLHRYNVLGFNILMFLSLILILITFSDKNNT